MAASLARQPNHGTAFGAADTFSDLKDDLEHDPETSCGFVRSLYFGEPCVLERPKQESLGRVLQSLHVRVKPIAPGGAYAQVHDFWESKPTELGELATKPDRAAQLEMVLVFERALAQKLLLDRSIVEAANKLDFWIGYEQCAIVILGTALALLLVAAWVQEIPEIASTRILSSLLDGTASPTQGQSVFDDLLLRAGTQLGNAPDWPLRASQAFRLVQIARDEADPSLPHARTLSAAVQEEATAIDDRRWFFGWALAAIPALGFLGTVRGILAAIGGVGGMADAETRLSSAVAIGNVSGSLSLAFSTTMLALIAVLVLGLADQWQVASQRKRLDVIEEYLRTMAGVK